MRGEIGLNKNLLIGLIFFLFSTAQAGEKNKKGCDADIAARAAGIVNQLVSMGVIPPGANVRIVLPLSLQPQSKPPRQPTGFSPAAARKLLRRAGPPPSKRRQPSSAKSNSSRDSGASVETNSRAPVKVTASQPGRVKGPNLTDKSPINLARDAMRVRGLDPELWEKQFLHNPFFESEGDHLAGFFRAVFEYRGHQVFEVDLSDEVTAEAAMIKIASVFKENGEPSVPDPVGKLLEVAGRQLKRGLIVRVDQTVIDSQDWEEVRTGLRLVAAPAPGQSNENVPFRVLQINRAGLDYYFNLDTDRGGTPHLAWVDLRSVRGNLQLASDILTFQTDRAWLREKGFPDKPNMEAIEGFRRSAQRWLTELGPFTKSEDELEVPEALEEAAFDLRLRSIAFPGALSTGALIEFPDGVRSDFAAALINAYHRFALTRGWNTRRLQNHPNILAIKGEGAFEALYLEQGIHRSEETVVTLRVAPIRRNEEGTETVRRLGREALFPLTPLELVRTFDDEGEEDMLDTSGTSHTDFFAGHLRSLLAFRIEKQRLAAKKRD